ncbi:uroporphyrinogen-III C-methyltransferase [Bacillus sp. OV322]|uniref:uroporphyrinogen-III C-methyltransferase n=1 Tax=Bacillus sp. OV322 TaxID=1882764 RepID=UPI0008E532CF|nr:uroporphyrinogen-III C-methyltransferase [Bacillus sp. OV322]
MGKVYLTGAGPGDPDLITVKGLRSIQEADVILYDRLVNEELLKNAKPGAELIYCGKLPDFHLMQQETINRFLVKYAKKGNVVTRLKGGDPFVFGRGGEEAEALAVNGIPFEVIPGITAGIAAPAYAGIPVTHRDYGSSFAFITGHKKNGEKDTHKWEALAKGIDTLAVYMGVKNLQYIQKKLIEHGKNPDTPVAFIHWGTFQEQRTVVTTLCKASETAAKENVVNPSLIIIGEVVKMRKKISWFEQLTFSESLLVSEGF